MLWAALIPDWPSCDNSPPEGAPEDGAARAAAALAGLAAWCLQFTPRVDIFEAETAWPAVVMELAASVRLFGGRGRLARRIGAGARELGVRSVGWAPTAAAAVALARCGQADGFRAPLPELLDALPLEALTPVAVHAQALSHLGCATLGQVRALPRAGLARRFDAGLLAALDRAYGTAPETHAWIALPERFRARLELPARVEQAEALLFGARRLLAQMGGWLVARHAGVTAFTLRWSHDAMRPKSAGEGGELTVRTGTPTRRVEHLARLLAEHLARTKLAAPVGDLELIAREVRTLEEKNAALLPDARTRGEALDLVLERVAARLGDARVLRPVLHEDHRTEWMAHWQPAFALRPRREAHCADLPQPAFVLDQPLRLSVRQHLPVYRGPLQLLIGPHRVEGGWWDRAERDGAPVMRNVARDYWVALGERAGVLWVFRTRLADDDVAWFLQGSFA